MESSTKHNKKYKKYTAESRSKSKTSDSGDSNNSSRSRSRSRGKNYDSKHTSRSKSKSSYSSRSNSSRSSAGRYNNNDIGEDRYNGGGGGGGGGNQYYRKNYRNNFNPNFSGKSYNFSSKSINNSQFPPHPYMSKQYAGGGGGSSSSYKYNKFQQKSKYYNFNNKQQFPPSNNAGDGKQPPPPFAPYGAAGAHHPRYNNHQNYKLNKNNPLQMLNLDLPPNISQSTALLLNNINPETMTPEQQAFLKKKLPNYRLLGRNIFDTNVKSQFNKSRKKTNTYYSRFLKQHPANNLPLAFQKSMSLAEDKALEEKEKQHHKKEKKKKHKTTTSETTSDNEGAGGGSSNNSDDSDESAELDKQHKFYSDISSDSDLESSSKKKSKKKDKKKKKKKKKQSKNKDELSSGGSSASNSPRTSSKHQFLGDFSDNDSNDSMMDLRENLKPIGDYIGNREQMLNEMLRCIKGSKLHAMLPDILKDKPFDTIKSKCMDELESMSKKRLRYLILGKDMTSSSGTEESSDDGKISYLAPNKESIQENKILSKFKPIDSLNKEENLNKIEEHDDSQDSVVLNPEIANTNQETPLQTQQQQQSGFVAAGFKKFVKKSISIKLKTTEPSINNTMIKQDESNKMSQQFLSNRYEDKYSYDVDSDDYNEVRNELNSILELESTGKGNNRTNYLFKSDYSSKQSNSSNNRYLNRNHTAKSYVNQLSREIETNSYGYDLDVASAATVGGGDSSCDYDYDLGDDLSNIDSDNNEQLNNNNNKKHKKKRLDESDVSTYCSSCVDDDDDNDEELLLLNDSDNESILFSSLSSTEGVKTKHNSRKHQKEKVSSKKNHHHHHHLKASKERVSKKNSKKETKKIKSNEQKGNNNILYIKNTLKNILEMHIMNVSEDDDAELKEILMSLLSEIVNNESITLEECAFIHEKINQLYFDDDEEDEVKNHSNSLSTSEEEGEDEDEEEEEKKRRKERVSTTKSDERNKKRKRKEKSKDSIVEKKKRTSTISSDKNQAQKKENSKLLKKNVNNSNVNSKGEMMEAGEIDDMYDDEIIVERELENLLGFYP